MFSNIATFTLYSMYALLVSLSVLVAMNPLPTKNHVVTQVVYLNPIDAKSSDLHFEYDGMVLSKNLDQKILASNYSVVTIAENDKTDSDIHQTFSLKKYYIPSIYRTL